MIDDIALLLEFLERCEPEVNGHGQTDLKPELMAMIERFIAGKCSEVERRELSEFLQLHPAWIRWVADRVQLARDPGSEVAEAPSDKQASA